ncbi:MAG: hypothetical protein EXS05_15665 [Planctomycetaceae bacterium]|nr:hypothetical protein [Planctomycetaceae bacterium]
MNFGSRSAGSSSVRSAVAALGVLAVAASAVAIWASYSRRQDSSVHSSVTSDDRERQAVTLIVSGDTAGWIVPCGCTSNQSGGLLRRGTFIADQQSTGNLVVADAGGAPGGISDYQRLKFEAILRGELQMGLVAHNLGGPEAALGANYLRRVETELHVPFLSANLRDSAGKLVTKACRIVQAGSLRIALVGVLSPREKYNGCRVDDPRDAVLAVLTEAGGTYDRAVVLAWLGEAELRELAAALPEAHAVIGGPTGQSLSPQMVGPTLIASATNKGKFLACVTIPRTEREGRWSGTAVELTDRFDDDAAQVANLQAFRRELSARDFAAGSTGLVPPLPAELPSNYRIAGSRACETCHVSEFAAWRESGHSQAWETLAAENARVDPECQRCHTTGYGLPGGFETMASGADRVGVGCESCHGPSLAHVEQPKRKTPLAANDQCRRCHDRENSPQFEFATYWTRIQHGRQAASAASSPSDR